MLLQKSLNFPLNRDENNLLIACQKAMEEDHHAHYAKVKTVVATLQKIKYNHLDYIDKTNTISLFGHLPILCPVSLLTETTRSGRPIAVTAFSRN